MTRAGHRSFYGSAAWRALSASIRSGATRCTWCLKPTRVLVADHIIPLEQRPDLALEPTNVVPSCPSCNVRRGRNAKLKVPGPPTLREELAAIFERKETA